MLSGLHAEIEALRERNRGILGLTELPVFMLLFL